MDPRPNFRTPRFRVDEPMQLLPLIAAQPFATLTIGGEAELSTVHLPLLYRAEETASFLEGHIARGRFQWKQLGNTGVASFLLGHHYISPTWYPTKKHDPRTVPTWDYVAVEARGTLRWIEDRDWLAAFVRRLTESQEARIGSDWSVDDAPADYLEEEYRGIVGVEMRIESLVGIFKLNQHHPRENIDGIIEGLAALDTPQAASLLPFMRERE